MAKITHEGSLIDLGKYRPEVEAARAYDRAARKLKGPRWILNFPGHALGRSMP